MLVAYKGNPNVSVSSKRLDICVSTAVATGSIALVLR